MNGTQSSTARTALKFVLMVGIVSFFYSVQGFNCEDPERKGLLMDIGTEELSHLEVVGTLARMHLKPSKHDRNAAQADPLIAIYGAEERRFTTHKETRGRQITSKLRVSWM